MTAPKWAPLERWRRSTLAKLILKIEVVPHAEQRYPTSGDWTIAPDGAINVLVSDTGNLASALLTGILETTNEPYAIAKIAGIKLCESYNRQYGTDYRSVMPTNLYGENDNFHLENSHVIPAMIRKFHDAKTSQASTVTLWGTGTAMREFLHVDDMAAASLHVLGLNKEHYQACTEPMLSHLNVGTGTDVTIRELAETIQQVTGYQGDIVWDSSKPDGAPRKLMDVSKIKSLDWHPQIVLQEGLTNTYQWFIEHKNEFKAQ